MVAFMVQLNFLRQMNKKKMLSSIFIVKLGLISYKDLPASSSLVSMTSVTVTKMSLL